MAIRVSTSEPAIHHSRAFRMRRFLNWFPLGLTYALLYMGRYNLTVAKTSLGELMTKEDFGIIFAAGTITYALAFLVNGPLVDRIGGRRGILIGAMGSLIANAAMGAYLWYITDTNQAASAPLRAVFSALYAVNMYFQSYGAVSIVKVNAHWFHVTERGGFSGIFGTMISSGIFLAFTVNGWLLDWGESLFEGSSPASRAWIVFAVPALLLAAIWTVELFLLRDSPGKAGHEDFDTGDASSGEDDDQPVPVLQLFKRILTNPIIITVAFIELCTGVLRNGVMHWFPIYAKEIWVLPGEHLLRYGSWEHVWLIVGCFAVALVSGLIAAFGARGPRRAYLVVFAALAFLVPFFQAGWGGLLMVAGIIGGNVAGWVSDLFFQSRRGPAAGGLYLILAVLTLGMAFALARPTNEVMEAEEGSGLEPGDRILAIAGAEGIEGWSEVRYAVACWEPVCEDSVWDPEACLCSTADDLEARDPVEEARPIPATIERDGERVDVRLPDPRAVQEAGDLRLLDARPVLPLSPWVLGAIVFLMSLCVIGTHGLLSGTATMDFGGRRGAATAVGVIDGFVYLGTAIQSVSLGYLTTESWAYWPWFLLPFAVVGFLLCLRIWKAKPGG
ncbi:MAG TPA: MFS transporter [Sandaracinaceae bacterium LLY-WYZ-13_1]|nr:MFS transporter [Sandaracinaceae bacterium LLY-WYZ-13_1]